VKVIQGEAPSLGVRRPPYTLMSSDELAMNHPRTPGQRLPDFRGHASRKFVNMGKSTSAELCLQTLVRGFFSAHRRVG
jgi:hypothetical protein